MDCTRESSSALVFSVVICLFLNVPPFGNGKGGLSPTILPIPSPPLLSPLHYPFPCSPHLCGSTDSPRWHICAGPAVALTIRLIKTSPFASQWGAPCVACTEISWKIFYAAKAGLALLYELKQSEAKGRSRCPVQLNRSLTGVYRHSILFNVFYFWRNGGAK